MNTDTMDTTATAIVKTVAPTDISADTVIGGTDATDVTPVAENTSDTVAATPGAAARKRTGEMRDYTPRGTTYWARRVILKNGKPVGRGRPAAAGKGERKVVYVPVGMAYDVAIHGEGVKYNSHSHGDTHKRIRKDSVNYTFDDGVNPTATTTKTKAKTKAKAKAKTKAKTKTKTTAKTKTKAKAKKSNSNDVTVPVADVAPTVDPVPTVDIPAHTDAVTA